SAIVAVPTTYGGRYGRQADSRNRDGCGEQRRQCDSGSCQDGGQEGQKGGQESREESDAEKQGEEIQQGRQEIIGEKAGQEGREKDDAEEEKEGEEGEALTAARRAKA